MARILVQAGSWQEAMKGSDGNVRSRGAVSYPYKAAAIVTSPPRPYSLPHAARRAPITRGSYARPARSGCRRAARKGRWGGLWVVLQAQSRSHTYIELSRLSGGKNLTYGAFTSSPRAPYARRSFAPQELEQPGGSKSSRYFFEFQKYAGAKD